MNDLENKIIEKKINTSYGLYINLDKKMIETINKSMKSKAKKKVEVCIGFMGIVKEMSLSEFITRMLIKINA